jgi:hypothetical protein
VFTIMNNENVGFITNYLGIYNICSVDELWK